MRRPLEGAEFVIAAAVPAQWPEAGPAEIAFAGRSNAGKSSAINALARRTRLAFASRTPGRTQQIVFFALRDGARAADLPGYGYAAVSHDIKRAWQQSLWDYVTTRSTLVGLALVVDARHGLKPLDLALLDGFVPVGSAGADPRDQIGQAQPRGAARRRRGYPLGGERSLRECPGDACWRSRRRRGSASKRPTRCSTNGCHERERSGAVSEGIKMAPRSRGVTRGPRTPGIGSTRRRAPAQGGKRETFSVCWNGPARWCGVPRFARCYKIARVQSGCSTE